MVALHYPRQMKKSSELEKMQFLRTQIGTLGIAFEYGIHGETIEIVMDRQYQH